MTPVGSPSRACAAQALHGICRAGVNETLTSAPIASSGQAISASKRLAAAQQRSRDVVPFSTTRRRIMPVALTTLAAFAASPYTSVHAARLSTLLGGTQATTALIETPSKLRTSIQDSPVNFLSSPQITTSPTHMPSDFRPIDRLPLPDSDHGKEHQ